MNKCGVIFRSQVLTGKEGSISCGTGKARKTSRVWAGVGGACVEVELGVHRVWRRGGVQG